MLWRADETKATDLFMSGFGQGNFFEDVGVEVEIIRELKLA